MKSFRYSTHDHWFKGNTHIHSTASDGGLDFNQLTDLYAGAGYQFLFRTDHWISSDTSKDVDKYPILWIDGIELDGTDSMGSFFHVVCLGSIHGIGEKKNFDEALRLARLENSLTVIAHPHWTGNSFEDCLRLRPDGIEIYNHVCHWLNGKSNGLPYWEMLLRNNPATLAFAVDDAHLRPEHPGWNGGWIMVNSPTCNKESIISAIRNGNFYASTGPEFLTIENDGKHLHVQTSPVQFLKLVGPGSLGKQFGGFGTELITEVNMTLPEDWDFAYLEIEDAERRRAWTNALFI
jgi:hypothetical protein